MNIEGGKNHLLLSDTPIEDLFVWQYMGRLTKEGICLYLMLKSTAEGAFSEGRILEISPEDKEVTLSAMAELVAAGLFTRDRENRFVFVDIKQVEADSYCASVIARGGADLDELTNVPAHEEFMTLCSSISDSFYAGKMGFVFYRIIDRCVRDYGFESLVIYKLFDIAREKKIQYDYKAVEKLSSDWNRKGYKTAESLSRLLEENAKVELLKKTVGKITRTKVNDFDIERIEKWVSLGFEPDLIEFAFRSCEYKGVKTANADEKLTSWNMAGVKTLAEAKTYEKELHDDNLKRFKKQKRSGGSYSEHQTGSEAGITADTRKAEASSGEGDILDLFGGEDDA